MSWQEFEHAMADAFRHQGYAVTVTPDGADGGVDLILDRDGQRVLVQCKHWNVWKVGVKVVRELYGVMAAQGVSSGIVATSGRFTAESRSFARGAGIQLLDGRDVSTMLLAVPVPVTDDASSRQLPWTGADSPRCPRCGEHMVIRSAQRGNRVGERFWGCPRFPACRGVQPVGSPTGNTERSRENPRRSSTRGPVGGTRSRSRDRLRGPLVVAVVAIVLLLGVPVLFGSLASLSTLASTGSTGRATVTPPAVTNKPVGETPDVIVPPVPSDPRITAAIPLPERPYGIAVDSAGRQLYVSHRDSSSISVVDLATSRVVREIHLDRQPLGLAFDEVSRTVWVTNFNDASVTVLDESGQVNVVVDVGRGPTAVAVDPERNLAFVTSSVDKSLSVIDVASGMVVEVKAASTSSSVTVDPVTRRVCLVNTALMDFVQCYDEELRLIHSTGGMGDALAIDPLRHDWYGTAKSNEQLRFLDSGSGELTTVALEAIPTGLAVEPISRLVYVAVADNRILVVRLHE